MLGQCPEAVVCPSAVEGPDLFTLCAGTPLHAACHVAPSSSLVVQGGINGQQPGKHDFAAECRLLSAASQLQGPDLIPFDVAKQNVVMLELFSRLSQQAAVQFIRTTSVVESPASAGSAAGNVTMTMIAEHMVNSSSLSVYQVDILSGWL